MQRTVIQLLVFSILHAGVAPSMGGPGIGTIWDRDVPLKDRATIAAFYGGVILAFGGAWAIDKLRSADKEAEKKDETPMAVDAESLKAVEAVIAHIENTPIEFAADVTDEQVKTILRLERLKHLNVAKSKVSEKSLETLVSLRSLESLVLPPITTNATLKKLSILPHLKELNLTGAMSINDDCVEDITRFKNLKTIVVKGTAISEAGIANLRKAMPLVNVIR